MARSIGLFSFWLTAASAIIACANAPLTLFASDHPEDGMADTNWTIHGREFVNCNCSYGCPCQFNGLPTHGNCQAVAGMQIEQGHHGTTKLDGLKFIGIFRWPGAIHEGKGEAADRKSTRLNASHR